MFDKTRESVDERSKQSENGQLTKKILDLIPYMFPFIMLVVLVIIILILRLFQVI